jgi:hypothetical protein
MNRVKLFAVAMTALVAVVAFTATSAFAAAEFLSEFPNAFVNAKQIGKGALKNLNNEVIECNKGEVLGSIVSKTLAEVDTHFSECKALGFQANTLGDSAGVILTGTVSAVPCLINNKELEVGIFLTLAAPLHIEVPSLGALVTVLGTIIGKVTPDGVNTKGPYKIVFKETAAKTGDPEWTSCGGKTASLLSAIDTKTEVSSAINATFEGEVAKLLTIDG